MQGTDETPAHAEQRQTFLRHLPKRLDSARRRGRRLTARGWDINALLLMHREFRTLAAACEHYGLRELADALKQIDDALAPHASGDSVPDTGQTDDVVILLDRLDPLLGASEAEAEPIATEYSDDLEALAAFDVDTASDGFEYQTTPPAEFVAQFAKTPEFREVEAAPSAPAAAAPSFAAPTPAPVANPVVEPEIARPTTRVPAATVVRNEHRRVYHLSDGNALALELDQKLEAQGFTLEVLDNAVELNEVMRALTPSLVIVDAAFGDDLEEIGQAIRAVRTRSSHKVALLALSSSADVASRLRAMRAGADSFMAQPAYAAEVLARAHELLDADTAEPYRVMIIEDDRSQAMFAESILRKAGMETVAVTDPLHALETLETFNPELILMDLYMPDCDGMELTALIRERERFISTPIVFLSGEHDTDKRFDALNAGGDDYLEKPIRPKYLISAVTNRVRRARALNRRVATVNPRDAHTGLYDRAYLLDRIQEAVTSDEGTNLGGLLFIIIDGAQAIRERIGLSAFDALLNQAGSLLSNSIAATDLAARYGDTSFVMLAPGRGAQALVAFGEDLRTRFSRHVFEIDEKTLTLAISVGIAPFAYGFADAAGVLNAAERAASVARADRDRKVKLYERTAAPTGSQDALLEALNHALRDDRFQLLFQPILSLHGESEEKFQVLLRMPGPGERVHTAAEIIPVAERAGLIHEVDKWVLQRCIHRLHERDRVDRPVHLFVNQSVQGMLDPERPAWIKRQLDTNMVGGERLVLEFRFADIRESVVRATTFAQAVRQFGTRVALAGFELNDSALQALDLMPVDYLKLSPRYLLPAHRGELLQLVQVAKERNLLVLAPQIEDAQTAATFWTIGVDYVQGNFVQQATHDLEFDFQASL